jgi:formate--tetrahydrofolate ligase
MASMSTPHPETGPSLTSLEISRSAHLLPIETVAARAGITAEQLSLYGPYIAKVAPAAVVTADVRPAGKYIVVTAVTPTPLGEGKTTTAIGLAQGLAQLGHRTMLTLRQPSLGPTFGIKGGAAGAGYSQVVPMEAVNLHLTGDFHAVTAAHNLLTAMLDNHLHHGNELGIDVRTIAWRRVLDVNDRALRNIVVGLGERVDGVTRQAGFDITAASEVMAILSLAASLSDLRARLGRIVVAFTHAGVPVTAQDLKAAGAMTVLLREAIAPNLLQTLENTPVLVHTGPFANIATGNSSVVGDLLGLRSAQYLLTEAGFGSDLGAERFFNVKCRASGLRPDAAVLVVTVRALKAHSGRYQVQAGRPLPAAMLQEKPDDVAAGGANLTAHIRIVQKFGISPVVAINAFPGDFESEHQVIRDIATAAGVPAAVTRPVTEGGRGALELARLVVEAGARPSAFTHLYDLGLPLAGKIDTVAREIYGADGVDIAPRAAVALARFEELGYGSFPVVIAKTHLSLSHDPTRPGVPTRWRLPVREVRAAVGAGYVYAICGDLRTMPGLPKHPAAERIDIDDDGNIIGLT